MSAVESPKSVTTTFGAGLVEAVPDVAVRYLREWHGSLSAGVDADGEPEARLVSLVSLPSRKSLALPVDKLAGAVEKNGLDELIYPGSAVSGADGGPGGTGSAGAGVQNLYVSAALLRSAPPRGRRGGKDYIGRSPGVWMDLDVREGGFADWGAVWGVVDRFDSLGMGPGIVVATGGGGAHLYWHVVPAVDGGGIEGEGLSPEDCEELGRGLRLWTQLQVGVPIDSCENADRVLRLPGSVHWPKTVGAGAGAGAGGAGDGATACSLVRCETRWVQAEALAGLTAGAVREWRERTRASREMYRDRARLAEAEVYGFLSRNGNAAEHEMTQKDSWSYQFALIYAEESYNETVPWTQILEPFGWRRHGSPDREGRVEWARPGGGEHSGRSLVTDWLESPNVGSLLSMAPETRLRGLYDAGVPLTKARVAAELWYGGDMARLLTDWLGRR